MKVFVLGILLVSLYCIEGALVKRDTEGEAAAEPTESPLSFARFHQTFAEFFKKDSITDYAGQARAYLQQLHERLVNEQLTDRIRQAFDTVVESAKAAIQ